MENDEPARPVLSDITRLPVANSSHDCGSLSRVVMVRKTDQRVINHIGPRDQQCEIVTLETIQTYKGHKPDKTVVIKETRDLSGKSFNTSCSSSSNNSQFKNDTNNYSKSKRSPSPNEKLKFCQNRFKTSSLIDSLNSPVNSQTKSMTTVNKRSDSLCVKKPDRSTPSPSSSVRASNSPSPVSKLGSNSFNEFENVCLEKHNEYRCLHNVPPLKLSRKLCNYAEEWAKVIASRGSPTHRSNSPYGENIFCAWSSNHTYDVDGKEPVDRWYQEISSHIFGKEPASLKSGHFTQVVWLDSRDFGVAKAKNRSGQVFVVANYDPPGNFIGSFTENVPPVGGFKSSSSKLDVSSIMTKSTPSTGSLPSSPVEDFAKIIQKTHNEYRKKHGAGDLQLSLTLSDIAQDWANILAREDRFAHRPNSEYGENIYCLWSSESNAKVNPKDVVRSWYDEMKEYTFGLEPRGVLKAGHFTQAVWKSTKELGVGMAKTSKGKVLVVCNYHPRGNVIGQFASNVLRPK